MFRHGHFEQPSSPDLSFSGSSCSLDNNIMTTPPQHSSRFSMTTPDPPQHSSFSMQHGLSPYHSSSPIPTFSSPGFSHTTNQMLLSLMESQKKVLSVVENVQHRLDDLEHLVQTVTNNSNKDDSTKADVKTRIPSHLSVSMDFMTFMLLIIFFLLRKWLQAYITHMTTHNSSEHSSGMCT